MLHKRANQLCLRVVFQDIQKSVEILSHIVHLGVIPTKADIVRQLVQELHPGLQRLEGQSARQHHIGAEVIDHFQTQHIPVKSQGSLHIPHRKQRAARFQSHIQPSLNPISLSESPTTPQP